MRKVFLLGQDFVCDVPVLVSVGLFRRMSGSELKMWINNLLLSASWHALSWNILCLHKSARLTGDMELLK
jgi:hypothetical protein